MATSKTIPRRSSPEEKNTDPLREHIPGPGWAPTALFLLVLLFDLAFLGLVRFPEYDTAVVLDPSPHAPTALVPDPRTSSIATGSPVTATHPNGDTDPLVVLESTTLHATHEFGRWGVPPKMEPPVQVLRLRPLQGDSAPTTREPGTQLSVRVTHTTLLQYAIDFVRTR